MLEGDSTKAGDARGAGGRIRGRVISQVRLESAIVKHKPRSQCFVPMDGDLRVLLCTIPDTQGDRLAGSETLPAMFPGEQEGHPATASGSLSLIKSKSHCYV